MTVTYELCVTCTTHSGIVYSFIEEFDTFDEAQAYMKSPPLRFPNAKFELEKVTTTREPVPLTPPRRTDYGAMAAPIEPVDLNKQRGVVIQYDWQFWIARINAERRQR